MAMLKSSIVILFLVFRLCNIRIVHGCLATVPGEGAGTGPSTPSNACVDGPTNTAGITIYQIQTQNIFTYATATAHCTSCPSGSRQFYNSASTADYTDALNNNQAIATVQCDTPANLCICQASGTCCTPGATPPDEVHLIPYCSAGSCQVYAVLQGADDASIMCGGTTYTVQTTTMVNSGAFPTADSVSCSGCNQIRNDVCQKPIVTGPSPAATG
ncbi:unnamed protein product [Bursaphelenchus okinawaensis]|uniref:Uncharacterized protein n=1 Tax=Bursaphelenchus okinawaensis TaxID=465554 RepID=A0A811L7T1_9BILA|nr:unnamed protein product [Bursaphelenchus okinawaensis]CAG9117353.1 unnamed protein product [Bursaphelenchus okinawaensis]